MNWLGPLRGPLERFLSGGAAPSDPLYLTHRTIQQRLRVVAVFAVPCLVVAAVLGLGLTALLPKPKPAPGPQLTSHELAEKILPHMDNLRIDVDEEAEVQEVQVDRSGPPKVTGTIHNNTGHAIRSVLVVLALTDAGGSQVGAVSGRIEGLPARGLAKFSFPIQQKDATYALVREVRTE